MKAVTRNQMGDLAARFISDTHWASLDGEKLQAGINTLPHEELGRRFTEFLRNGGIFPLEIPPTLLMVDRYTPILNPKDFPPDEWGIWRGLHDGDGLEGERAEDKCCNHIDRIDISVLRFDMCREGKAGRWLTTIGPIFPDLKIADALYREKGQASLEWLYRVHGLTVLEFKGTMLRNAEGRRVYMSLDRSAPGHWRYHVNFPQS